MNPFDLPVHPVVAHVPVAMLGAGWVALVLRYVVRRPDFEAHARLFLLVGVVSLPFTIVAGFIDTRGVDFVLDPRWDQPLIWHMTSGLATTGLLTGHLLWRRRALDHPTRRVVALDLAWVTAGVWVMVLAGAIAGEMVYAS